MWDCNGFKRGSWLLVTIGLEALEVFSVIGALEEERKNKQSIFIDITLSYNAKEAIEKDDVEKVVDYRFLEESCEKISKNHFCLLETFASALLEELFSKPLISYAKVKVSKKAFGIKAKRSFAMFEKSR